MNYGITKICLSNTKILSMVKNEACKMGQQMQKQTKKTALVIAEDVIARVQAGELAVGSPLPTERELCEAFSTSRPTVREAISRLELLGYLTGDTGRRPVVLKPTLEEIAKNSGTALIAAARDQEKLPYLEQLRQFIEVGAVRAAVTRASQRQISLIRQSLDYTKETMGTDAFTQADIEFHVAIVSIIDNPILVTLHRQFVEILIDTRRQKMPSDHDEVTFSEHRRIVEAILKRDETLATRQMESHLERAYRQRLSVGLYD